MRLQLKAIVIKYAGDGKLMNTKLEEIELEVVLIRKIIGRIEVMALVALGFLIADMFIR
jgi:hypothetical protein